MTGVGAYLALDYLTKPYGLAIAGFVLIGGGLFITFNGTMGFIGGCKQKHAMIKAIMYLSIIQIFIMLTVLLVFFSAAKKVQE